MTSLFYSVLFNIADGSCAVICVSLDVHTCRLSSPASLRHMTRGLHQLNAQSSLSSSSRYPSHLQPRRGERRGARVQPRVPFSSFSAVTWSRTQADAVCALALHGRHVCGQTSQTGRKAPENKFPFDLYLVHATKHSLREECS